MTILYKVAFRRIFAIQDAFLYAWLFVLSKSSGSLCNEMCKVVIINRKINCLDSYNIHIDI